MTRTVLRTVGVVAVLTAAAAFVIAVPQLPERGTTVPTAKVARGPLPLIVHARGDLRAGRTTTLVAPPVGGILRIVHLVTTGLSVKAGDVVMEFDPADHRFALKQAKTEIAEAEQEIRKMKADVAAQAAEDKVALLTARFAVRRAELDTFGNELIGAIEAKKNLLTLEEAKRALEELDVDAKSRSVTEAASLAILQEKRNRAMLAVERAQQVIERLVLRAPMDGVAMVKENRDALGGAVFTGVAMPQYREGDTVFPGRAVIDVIEAGHMEVRAKVNEIDRAILVEGQEALVRVDSLPGEGFKARVGALCGLANRGGLFASASITRQVEVSLELEAADPRMKGGTSVSITVEGKEIPDALTVPRQAVFQKHGKTYVYVKTGDRFEQQEVTVVQRTESRAALEGLAEGIDVALVDPDAIGLAALSASTSPVPAASR